VRKPRALALAATAGLVAAVLAFAVITAVDGDDERGGAGQAAPAEHAEAPPAVAHANGRELFFQMGCGSCHRFRDAGSTGVIGPDLDERLAAYDRPSLRATIVTPPGSAPGSFSVMPDNFAARMKSEALDALVAYLLAARRGTADR
jgi:mono/diheme cytochrome c family protein